MVVSEGPLYFCERCSLIVRDDGICPNCEEQADEVGWVKTNE